MAISRKIRKKSSLISLQNLGEVEFPKKQAAASRGRKVWRIQVDKRLKFIQPQGLMGSKFPWCAPINRGDWQWGPCSTSMLEGRVSSQTLELFLASKSESTRALVHRPFHPLPEKQRILAYHFTRCQNLVHLHGNILGYPWYYRYWTPTKKKQPWSFT